MLEFYEGSSTSLPACSITLIILSTIAVIGRVVSRRISAAKFWWDDTLTIISLLNSYVVHAFAFIDVRNGAGRHIETITPNQRKAFLRVAYANQIHYPLSISAIKLAILLFYLRLFGSRQGFKKAIYVSGALVISWSLAGVFTAIFGCTPTRAAFLLDTVYRKQHCINICALLISMSVSNVLLEVLILILPLFFIWTLQLSSRRKAGLSGIFMLGACATGATIARAWSVFSSDPHDFTWSSGSILFWSVVEISIGVICACLPTLPPILTVLVRKLSETAAFWSTRLNKNKSKNKEICDSDLSTRQKGGTTPEPSKKKTALQLTLGNASWRALDYKGFGHDNDFKEVGITLSSSV